MTFSFNKILRTTFLLCALHISLFLIMFPSVCIETGKSAVNVCLTSIVPALFPFLICSGYFSASGAAAACSRYLSPLMRPVFKLPGCSAMAFILGIVSGYPVGAACAKDLYNSGQCTKAEAEQMCAFCNNSGPLFIMSVVGCGFLGSPQAGRYLYASHIISAIIVGIIFRFYKTRERIPHLRTLSPKPLSDIKDAVGILGSVMDSSVFTMLKICGFILFFTVFAASLPKTGFTPYLHSFLEITGGIKQIAALELSLDTRMCIISFFAAFSGVSVILQVGAITAPCGLSLMPFITGKLLQGLISAGITSLILRFFPITQAIFLQQKSPADIISAEPLDILFYSLSVIFAIIVVFTVILAALAFFRKRMVK